MKTKYSKDQLNQTGVYAIVHKESGKRYIGSAALSFKDRWAVHKSKLRKGTHHSIHLQNAWNKYTEFAFDFIILEIVPKEEWKDNKYLTDVEQMWLDSHQPEYNISSTAGNPMLGRTHTEETKQKISETQKGEKNHLWGKNHSEETRQKISKSSKGRVLSEEAKKNISEGHCKYTYTLISPEGKEYQTISLRSFAKEWELDHRSLYKVLNGKSKYHKGWHSITKTEIAA